MYKIILFIIALCVFPLLNGQGLFEAAQEEASEAVEGNSSLGGFVRSAIYIGNSTDDEVPYLQSIYGQLGVISDVRLGSSGAAYADLRFRYGNEFEKAVSEIDLREAYIDLFGGPVSLRSGKQIISWGASSFINPSDQFSPSNPIFRSPDPDDMKIGVWSMNAKLSIAASSSLQLIWTPLYQPSVLLTEPFSFPEYVGFTDPALPKPEIRNGNYGFLYDLRTSALDGSLSYYNGYRNNPRFSLESAAFDPVSMEPTMISMFQEPFRIHSAGFNMSVPFGSYIFRTEAAWLSTVDSAETNSYLPLSEVSYIGEIEQSGANVTFIAGYYGKYILSFEAPAAEAASLTGSFPDLTTLLPPGVPVTPELIDGMIGSQIDAFNRLYDYQLHEFYHSVYASVTINLLNDVLKIELPGMYNITSKELLLRPSIEYSVTDGIIVEGGVSYMRGEENTLYDLVGPVLNAGFLSFKVLF